MAVKIRLTRMGARNAARYRVVATDARAPREGRVLETLGWYDPTRTEGNCEIKLDRIDFWKERGACVSDTVSSLVKKVRKTVPVEA